MRELSRYVFYQAHCHPFPPLSTDTKDSLDLSHIFFIMLNSDHCNKTLKEAVQYVSKWMVSCNLRNTLQY